MAFISTIPLENFIHHRDAEFTKVFFLFLFVERTKRNKSMPFGQIF